MLKFSQSSQPTPSAQLGNSLKAMSLGSQSQSAGGAPTQGERPPPPLFSEGGPPPGAACLAPLEIPSLSQQDLLGTQDFITPVDQFGMEYDPKDAKRSPARLSPNRVKRPRQGGAGDVGMDEGAATLTEPRGGLAGPSGRGGSWGSGAGGRRPLARLQSPPCYRNIFADEDSEEAYAQWKAPRPQQQQQLSRYRQDFKEVGLLGQGNFSKVFRVRHRFDGREYAVKRSQREAQPESQAFAQFIQEAQVLAHLPPHPNVVQYFGCWSEPGGEGEHLYLQLEKCDVNLGIHASLGEQLREADLLEVLRQMASALAHLHRHGVAHLDVKPDNIYLQDVPEEEAASSGGAPAVRYKLGDFGLAMRLNLRTPACFDEGDSRYLPLEVLNGQLGQLHKADMFSLGATLLELATRTELPSGGQQYQDLRAGKLPLLPTCTQRFANMIRALMSPRPEDRPSAEKVLQSSLLAPKSGSPGVSTQQQLAHQLSTASAASTATTATGGGATGATGSSRQFGGLVLQRSMAC
ncbi:hypothetical protein ABPG75_001305 [Micractinium tetrahymenae]